MEWNYDLKSAPTHEHCTLNHLGLCWTLLSEHVRSFVGGHLLENNWTCPSRWPNVLQFAPSILAASRQSNYTFLQIGVYGAVKKENNMSDSGRSLVG